MLKREEMELKLKLLLNQSMKGDRASYESFLELSSVLIKRYLKQLGGRHAQRETVEDLLQEVLITLHEKKHTYREDRAFLPWLYAIIRHRYIDYYRSRKRVPTQTSLEEMGDLIGDSEQLPSFDMEEIMSLLTPKQKEMLYLVKVEGQSYKEAAATLSMSVSAVKVGVHRLVKSLQGKVDHEE